jgi:hypothetical protein
MSPVWIHTSLYRNWQVFTYLGEVMATKIPLQSLYGVP